MSSIGIGMGSREIVQIFFSRILGKGLSRCFGFWKQYSMSYLLYIF